MERLIIYRFSDERKKWRNIRKRKELFNKNNWVCENCLEKKKYHELIVEHDYPCVLGGQNVKVLCEKCHKPKTNFDINIINFFKKMNFIAITRYETYFFISKNKLKKIYYLIRKTKKDR